VAPQVETFEQLLSLSIDMGGAGQNYARRAASSEVRRALASQAAKKPSELIAALVLQRDHKILTSLKECVFEGNLDP